MRVAVSAVRLDAKPSGLPDPSVRDDNAAETGMGHDDPSIQLARGDLEKQRSFQMILRLAVERDEPRVDAVTPRSERERVNLAGHAFADGVLDRPLGRVEVGHGVAHVVVDVEPALHRDGFAGEGETDTQRCPRGRGAGWAIDADAGDLHAAAPRAVQCGLRAPRPPAPRPRAGSP